MLEEQNVHCGVRILPSVLAKCSGPGKLTPEGLGNSKGGSSPTNPEPAVPGDGMPGHGAWFWLTR